MTTIDWIVFSALTLALVCICSLALYGWRRKWTAWLDEGERKNQ